MRLGEGLSTPALAMAGTSTACMCAHVVSAGALLEWAEAEQAGRLRLSRLGGLRDTQFMRLRKRHTSTQASGRSLGTIWNWEGR